MYKRLKSLILISVIVILAVGCSKEESKVGETKVEKTSKEEKVVQEVKGVEDILTGKYIHIADNKSDTGSIFYFKEDEIVLMYGYHVDLYKILERNSSENSTTYKLSTTEFGNPDNVINSTLSISKNEDGSIYMKWQYEDGSSNEENNLKLLTAKECVESIVSSYPTYKHDRLWDDLGLTAELFDEVYKEVSKKESNNQISAEEALQICKDKIKGTWNTDNLFIGDGEFGLERVIDINGRQYYGVYYRETDDIVGDFRFCVSISTGEVFYQDVADMQSLTPIDEYLKEVL